MTEAMLARLVDRQAIVDVFNDYARGVDTRDEALYRSCFADELDLDMWGGDGPTTSTAEDWVTKAFAAVSSFETTQHIITNHQIEIDGDRAFARAYLQAQHWNPDNAMLVGGFYENDFVRVEGRWRICKLCLKVTWTKLA